MEKYEIPAKQNFTKTPMQGTIKRERARHSGIRRHSSKLYHSLLEEFKKEQMGYAAIAIIGQSCIGSVAAMLILMGNAPKMALLAQLFLVTILCMGFNGAVLAQQKPRIVFNLLLVSVVFNVLIIALYLI